MEENQVTKTTKSIAFTLLIFYGLFLTATFVAAFWFVDKQSADKWLSIFQGGLTFLGGALATIIGYYFGNRNTEIALDKARTEEVKAKEADEKAKLEEAKKETIKRILSSVKKDDSEGAEISPVRSEEVPLAMPIREE